MSPTKPCVAALLAICSAAGGFAQEDMPIPKKSLTYTWSVWRTQPNGEPESIGSEAVEILTTDKQRVIGSTSKLSLGPQAVELTQSLIVDKAGEFVRYTLKSGTHVLTCERTDAGVVLKGKVMGGDQARTLTPEGLVICLDNLAWSHYDVLGQHAAKRGKPFEFTALVPQALLGIPGRCVPSKDELKVTDGGETRRAFRGRLSAASLLVEFVYDAGSGVVYEVSVPSQRLLARRGDWRVEGSDEAEPKQAGLELPAGVREEALTLPTPGYEPGLPAKFTAPVGKGPFVAALLLSGSGPNDLDETIGPNKPLRDLAWLLAQEGVASLRFTKRTKHVLEHMKQLNGEEQKRLSNQLAGMGLKEEYLDDAQAALALLRARPDVQGDAIVVVGHSLGALMAPEIATAGKTQGVVQLAGPGRRIDALLRDQIRAGQLRLGKTEAEADAATAEVLKPFDGLMENPNPEGRFMGASLAYWKAVASRDPVQLCKNLDQPLCVVWGERDIQVTRPDFEALEKVYLERQRPKDGLLRYPGLNHLFMPCEEGAGGEEYLIPARFDAKVGKQVATWILAAQK